MPPAKELTKFYEKPPFSSRNTPTPPQNTRHPNLAPEFLFPTPDERGLRGVSETILILKSLSTEYATKEVLILKISRFTEIFLF